MDTSEKSIESCVETNRLAIRALIVVADKCRASLEAHARMKDAAVDANTIAEHIRSCLRDICAIE